MSEQINDQEVITVPVSELSGAALDWAVAKIVCKESDSGRWIVVPGRDGKTRGIFAVESGQGSLAMNRGVFKPSANWSHGGPLIEKYRIDIEYGDTGKSDLVAGFDREYGDLTRYQLGETTLIAVCRAVVAKELGDKARVPAKLLEMQNE